MAQQGEDGPWPEVVAEMVRQVGCTEDEARFFLEATAGNVDRALEMYREQMAVRNPLPPRPVAPALRQQRGQVSPPVRHGPPAGPSQHPTQRASGGFLNRVLRLPLRLLHATFNIAFRTVGFGLDILGFLSYRILPAPLWRALKGSADAIAKGSEVMDPTVSAELFVAEFKSAYGEACPNWVLGPWQSAVTKANREFKFLLVYLHSSEHQDTDPFCKETLCSPELVEYINDNFVVWGGNVRYSDPHSFSQSLRVTTFPYLALLIGPSSRLKMVCALEGKRGARVIQAALEQAVDDHGAQLVVDRTEAQEREFNRTLREEQDREYQESLERDRLREEALAAERAKIEEEERALAEEEARIRAEQEAEEQRKLDFQNALQARRDKALSLVTEAPEAKEPDTCSLRVRLPNGANLQRRFRLSDKIQAVYDFVDTHEDFEVLEYSLVSNFPHCVYGGEKRQMTLGDAGLAGAMLLIQSLDG